MTLQTFGVTADVALFSGIGRELAILLIKRGNEPYAGRWALPGGFVDQDEDLDEAAARELEEETGIMVSTDELRQVGVYGRPGRDPRMRVITVVYAAFVADMEDPVGGDDAAEAKLWSVREVLDSPDMLAFDHHEVISETVAATRLSPR